jgi:hypothetical protein
MILRKAYPVFALVLFLAAFVQAADFDAFEKSLAQGDSDSSATTGNDFEQSLMNEQGSEMSFIYRGREALMQAIKSGDTAEIAQKISELDNMKSGGAIPLVNIEKEIIYMNSNMWRQLLHHEVDLFKTYYDSVGTENGQYAENDELMIYVKKKMAEIDSNKTLYATYASQIEKAQLQESEKMELEIVLLLHNAYTKGVYSRIAELTRTFCEKFPDHPDVEWLKKSVAAPAERMDVRQMYYAERAERKEEFIAKNFYTGGLGVNVFFMPGGLAFGFDDFYRSDIFEPQDPGIYLEFFLQVKRFAIIGELLGSGVTGLASYSLGFGYVVYDSRYFKVRPYAAIGMPNMYLDVEKVAKAPDGPDGQVWDLHKGDTEEIDEGLVATLAVNVDFKCLTAFLFTSNNKFFSLSLVGKFGVSYIDASGDFVEGSGVSPFFNLGLGFHFW